MNSMLLFFTRGAAPLGVPCTLSRAPLRRRAPFVRLTRYRSLARISRQRLHFSETQSVARAAHPHSQRGALTPRHGIARRQFVCFSVAFSAAGPRSLAVWAIGDVSGDFKP